jgi:hypothetical protein
MASNVAGEFTKDQAGMTLLLGLADPTQPRRAQVFESNGFGELKWKEAKAISHVLASANVDTSAS